MTWTSIDTSPPWNPDWTNAPGQSNFRSYGTLDAVLEIDEDRLTCRVAKGAIRFLFAFWPLFMCLFFVVCWLGIDDAQTRTMMLACGTVGGIATFSLLYGIMHTTKHGANTSSSIASSGRSYSLGMINNLILRMSSDFSGSVVTTQMSRVAVTLISIYSLTRVTRFCIITLWEIRRANMLRQSQNLRGCLYFQSIAHAVFLASPIRTTDSYPDRHL